MVRRRQVERTAARATVIWAAYRRLEDARWRDRVSRSTEHRDRVVEALRAELDDADVEALTAISNGDVAGSAADAMYALAGPEPDRPAPDGPRLDGRAPVVNLSDWWQDRSRSRSRSR